MIQDHDRIEELLAGYVLQGLEGDDAREADRLLTEHVPDCAVCKETLADFQALTGDLALAADPIDPSDLLWPQIRRSMGEKPVGRGRKLALLAVAASIVAIFALAGWNVLLNGRISDESGDKQQLASMLADMTGDDGRRMVSLENPQHEPTMLISYLPGYPATRFVGVNVPDPAEGHVYRVWLIDAGESTYLADFEPSEGVVMIESNIDLSTYDEVVITEEPGGASSTFVPGGTVRWSGNVYAS